MSEKKVVAAMLPAKKSAAKKKAAPKKKAATKKAAPKKKAVVKKKAVKKPTVKKAAPVMVEDSDLGVVAFPKEDLPKVEVPGEFQRVEHPPMGVKDQDKEAAMFLVVVAVIAAIVAAMAFGV